MMLLMFIMAAPDPAPTVAALAAPVGNVNNYLTQSYKNRVDKLYYVYMTLRHLP